MLSNAWSTTVAFSTNAACTTLRRSSGFRVPLTQGLSAFTALQRQGIPSQFLHFPEENHWILKPANSVQWHRTVEAWLDRWTGEDDDARRAGMGTEN